jgi:predicted nucleotidyltransferase
MSEARDAVFELSSRISGHLSQIEGVEAVALGGSWARSEAHPNSDVDIGTYYRSGSPPSINELRRLARGLDDRHPHKTS